ncbi:MAG: hypothetical protein WBB00_02170 [Mycobacterium sp.]
MSLTDPHAALAEHSSFVGYLLGLVGVARSVRTLAGNADTGRTVLSGEADDMVHLLLGLASLGEAIERLAENAPAQPGSAATPTPDATTRWLR